MRKKRMRILAAILSGVLVIALAVPAAFAAQVENGTNETEQAQVTQQENGRQRGRTENGRTEDGTSGNMTGERPHAHGSHKRPEEPEAPENAIGKDAAKEIALADAGLNADQVEKARARLSDKDGTLVYKVSFKYDGQKYSYKIDPVSGEILDKTVSEATEHSHSSHERPEEPEAPENAIGKDAAKEIALADAGLTAEQVEKVRARLSDKDGTLVYKVSLKYDGQKYSYKIDPVSGEILDKTVSEATEHSGHGGMRPGNRAEDASGGVSDNT